MCTELEIHSKSAKSSQWQIKRGTETMRRLTFTLRWGIIAFRVWDLSSSLCHWTALSGREHWDRRHKDVPQRQTLQWWANQLPSSQLPFTFECLPIIDLLLTAWYLYRGALLKCRDKSVVLEPNHGLQVVLARWYWMRDSPSLSLNFFICYLRRGNSDIIKEWLKWWIQFLHVSCLELC